MSITDFLLARIAEDEAVARAAIDDLDFWDSPDTAPIGFLNASDLIDKYRPARVLAECAAKRAIVTYLQGLTADRKRDPETAAQYRATLWIAEQLAAVYSEHQDYRDEWRVGA